MVRRGARNLILISRSGVQATTSKRLVDELNSQGVHVETPRVDISDELSLRTGLAKLSAVMPRIRGCIQASVGLRVSCTEDSALAFKKSDNVIGQSLSEHDISRLDY